MTGYAYIAMGIKDVATSPVCQDDLTKSDTRQITAPTKGVCMEDGKTCPTKGRTVWADANKLCITGSVPLVDTSYADWGLQIGSNTSSPPAAEGGTTLGENTDSAASYTTITATTSGTITPAKKATNKATIRIVIHLKSMTCTEDPYCATMESGTPIKLTSFSTACWSSSCTGTCKKLTADDIPNIDKIGVQICADDKDAYTADPFCLEKIEFGKD